MNISLFHNPNCSKSRKTLELLEENGVNPNIVSYLTEPPSAESILRVAKALGVSVAELLRQGEEEFINASNLPHLDDEAGLARWIHEHPKVLQRPIVIDEASGKAVVGRPPENVLELIRQ
jgi:arsenate reductase